MHHCTVSVQNTEGKKTAIKRASSVTYYLRTPNASVMRTDFHCLAIDNPRMRLDLDKLLSSVHFNTKLQQNRKPSSVYQHLVLCRDLLCVSFLQILTCRHSITCQQVAFAGFIICKL